MSEISPCPKCGGKRIDTCGYMLGLDDERSIAIVCLSCRYVELYVKPEALENIKRLGSVVAGEYAAALAARSRELFKQIEEQPRKKFLFW